MSRRFEGKHCVVTGCSRGIGLAVCQRFLEEGATVHGLDRDRPPGDLSVQWSQVDVTSETQVRRFFDSLDSGVDVVVNNAAFCVGEDLFSGGADLWNEMLLANLTSVWLVTRYAAHLMRERAGGAIVNLGSATSIFGHPERTGYAAAKGGVIALTQTTALQLAPYDIRVNCVIPGAIATREAEDPHWSARTHQLIPRRGTPEECAAAIAFLASKDASFITGECLRVDGGAYRR